MSEKNRQAALLGAAARSEKAKITNMAVLRRLYVTTGNELFNRFDLAPVLRELSKGTRQAIIVRRVSRMCSYGIVEKVDTGIYRIRHVPFSWRVHRLLRKLTNGLLS